MTTNITPILKWAGGKIQLLGEMTSLLPTEEFTAYCEPFLGGGAMLFFIQPGVAYINDINSGLMNVYNVIKYYPEALIAELNEYENTAEFYSRIKELDRDFERFAALSAVQQAARFIYLNKTCFNGLYRENRQGQLMFPMESKKSEFYECFRDSLYEPIFQCFKYYL